MALLFLHPSWEPATPPPREDEAGSAPTSKMPCRLLRLPPSRVQKWMWDFPQVMSRVGSVGWNVAASTDSLEHCRGAGRERESVGSGAGAPARWGTADHGQNQPVTFTSASFCSFCQSHTERTWSLESSTAQRRLPPFWGGRKSPHGGRPECAAHARHENVASAGFVTKAVATPFWSPFPRPHPLPPKS